MLEKVDLTLALDKPTYKEALPKLQERLREGQNMALEHRIPVIIVFEGWDAAGKGSNISLLTEKLDPRHFRVIPVGPPTPDEARRPWLYRFWKKTPADGEITIFDRSWYGRVLVERVEKLTPKREWRLAFDEIDQFERQLSDDGALILKFWLHIRKREQKKRFKKLEADPTMAWKVTKEDWRHHKAYADYEAAVEEMLAKTSTHWAPWTIVEAEDDRYAAAKIHETVIKAIEEKTREIRRLKEESGAGSARAAAGRQPEASVASAGGNPAFAAPNPTHPVEAAAVEVADEERRPPGAEPEELGIVGRSTLLDQVNLTLAIPREEYRQTLRPLQARLRELQREILKDERPVLIVYEGWDAAGKGGNIKRLTQFLDPRGYYVIPYAAPTEEEKKHHYLWRFWRNLPDGGQIAIFDRTWYGRVLVERVEGFAKEQEWRRAYQEINEFEGQLTGGGTVLVKFWLHISPDEQLRRFESRQTDQFRHWKLTDEDWRNREKLPRYREAVIDMLEKTSTAWAPWTIVEANDKAYARVKALRSTIEAIETKL